MSEVIDNDNHDGQESVSDSADTKTEVHLHRDKKLNLCNDSREYPDEHAVAEKPKLQSIPRMISSLFNDLRYFGDGVNHSLETGRASRRAKPASDPPTRVMAVACNYNIVKEKSKTTENSPRPMRAAKRVAVQPPTEKGDDSNDQMGQASNAKRKAPRTKTRLLERKKSNINEAPDATGKGGNEFIVLPCKSCKSPNNNPLDLDDPPQKQSQTGNAEHDKPSSDPPSQSVLEIPPSQTTMTTSAPVTAMGLTLRLGVEGPKDHNAAPKAHSMTGVWKPDPSRSNNMETCTTHATKVAQIATLGSGSFVPIRRDSIATQETTNQERCGSFSPSPKRITPELGWHNGNFASLILYPFPSARGEPKSMDSDTTQACRGAAGGCTLINTVSYDCVGSGALYATVRHEPCSIQEEEMRAFLDDVLESGGASNALPILNIYHDVEEQQEILLVGSNSFNVFSDDEVSKDGLF
jgi:hypothetical protein